MIIDYYYDKNDKIFTHYIARCSSMIDYDFAKAMSHIHINPVIIRLNKKLGSRLLSIPQNVL